MPNGADLFVETLKQLGVTHLFTLVGDHLNEVLRVAHREGLNLIEVRHESAAAHMADGWGRLTRRPGVSLVTGGPGHTNSLTGLATAYTTCSPLIAISGMRPSQLGDRNAFQDLNQLSVVQGITKWAAIPPEPAQLPFYLSRAFSEALAGRPGPVHLSIPADFFTAQVSQTMGAPSLPVTTRPSPGSSEIERLLTLLAGAERPVVIAGSGVWWSDACAELEQFVHRAGLPVYTVCLGRGSVSDLEAHCFGYADPSLNRAFLEACRQADLILVLGKRIDYRLALGSPRLLNPAAKVVQIDLHPPELGLNRRLDLAICADVKVTLTALLAALPSEPPDSRTAWLDQLRSQDRAWREKLRAAAAAPGTLLHPGAVFEELGPLLPEDAVLCWDGGDFVHWGRALLPARRPGHWLRLGPLATLGSCLPIGLTAKILEPNRPSIVISGDGSLGFYLAELDTAVRHNLPVVVLVGNDGCWGIERELQLGIYGDGRTVACDLRRTRYDLVMKALGGEGEHVEHREQLRPALARALASDRPYLLNIEIRAARSPLAAYQLEAKK
jgi:acetolactate synthase-1/2/3 large subunit